jgi:hypothetical protein
MHYCITKPISRRWRDRLQYFLYSACDGAMLTFVSLLKKSLRGVVEFLEMPSCCTEQGKLWQSAFFWWMIIPS